jgi:hypothetical protein
MNAGAISLGAVVVACLGIVVIVLIAFARADKKKIEAYAIERGWKLKRVSCYPDYLIDRRFRPHTRSYFRAVFDCGAGSESTMWFMSTFGTDPIPTENPYPRS